MKIIDKFRNKRLTKKEFEVLHEKLFLNKTLKYGYKKVKDVTQAKKDGSFQEFGLTVYTGRQGSGKTISMVERLEEIRRDYPEAYIMTNFGYLKQDEPLVDWQQLIDVRNGDKGIIFAIDEIQNEFDVYEARNFNLDLLKVITQQRKQGIKILATSQVFTRVSKPLREQTYEVVECYTMGGRWTFQKCFDADDYNMYIDNADPDKRIKVRRKWRKNFVQTDSIRNKFDSYAVIESMTKIINERKKNKR